MPGPVEVLIVAVLLAGAFWWVRSCLLGPARELTAVLCRLAEGDYRPVMLTGKGPFLGRAARDLRILAETLSRQKNLLAEEEFSLAVILGSMTEGVVITGSDFRIRLLNAAATAIFHLEGGVTGLLLAEVFQSHELQGVAKRAAVTGVTQHGEFTLRIPGRSDRCHMAVTAAVLGFSKEGDFEGLLLVLHDVTRLRELESVRREFVANISHEFRTPLSVINGYLETLGEDEFSPEMLGKSVTVMQRHCDRLKRLIEDLLTISRMEEKGVCLETIPVDMGFVLREVVKQMETEIAERAVEVRLNIPANLPSVEVDVYRIEQAFTNLLANALRHGASGGGAIIISAAQSGRELGISFRDHGPGIPLKDQEHIFERFYRVGGDRARQTGGTGLGLSIVKNVVSAHGGRVTVESSPGAGAVFWVFLPLSLAAKS
jgi:two-component system phosphate regulon sensor histidine kinase PhoR